MCDYFSIDQLGITSGPAKVGLEAQKRCWGHVAQDAWACTQIWYIIIQLVNIMNFPPLFLICILLFFCCFLFSCLIALAKTSKTMLIKDSDCCYFCLLLHFDETVSCWFLIMMPNVCFMFVLPLSLKFIALIDSPWRDCWWFKTHLVLGYCGSTSINA